VMRIKRMKTPPELETERASTMSELASARERPDLVNPVIEKFLDQLPSLS
jgi:hypothetical protein